jgi:UrcA family protein
MTMIKINMTIATAAFIAAGICIGGATGVAAAQPEAVAAKVSYAGLDLSTAAGKEAMERRIEQAAEQLCGDIKTERLRTVREENARCTRETIANAKIELTRVAPAVLASR